MSIMQHFCDLRSRSAFADEDCRSYHEQRFESELMFSLNSRIQLNSGRYIFNYHLQYWWGGGDGVCPVHCGTFPGTAPAPIQSL